MHTAQQIIDILMSQGMTVKDIVELSGVSQPTISMIRSGQRSGKTSLPSLQRLLDSSETYQHHYTPSTVVESTVISIDNVPVPQKPTPQPRAIQPYVADIPLQERQERGIVYRQNRNRYGVTPDELMKEIQGLRLQLNDMSHQVKQQQKQRITQAHKEKIDHSSDTSIDLLSALAMFAHPFLEAHVYRDEQVLLEAPQPSPIPQRQETFIPQPSLIPQYQVYRRQGMYGIHPSRRDVQEEKPSTWQRFKKFLGYNG